MKRDVATGFKRERRNAREPPIWLPDQSHAGGVGRSLEPADPAGHRLRRRAALSRTATLGGAHRLEHPGRPAEDASRGGYAHTERRSLTQAEGRLQPDREVDRSGPSAGPDRRLGGSMAADDRRVQNPWPTDGGGRRTVTGTVHGGAAPGTPGRPPGGRAQR